MEIRFVQDVVQLRAIESIVWMVALVYGICCFVALCGVAWAALESWFALSDSKPKRAIRVKPVVEQAGEPRPLVSPVSNTACVAVLVLLGWAGFPASTQAQTRDPIEEANSLNDVAIQHFRLGKYAEAEQLYRRALALREGKLGPDAPSVATAANNLGEVCRLQGRYGEAEVLLKRAVAIREKAYGEAILTAASWNNLAILYRATGRFREAQDLLLRALKVWERVGPESQALAAGAANLGDTYAALGRYREAESLYLRALPIEEKSGETVGLAQLLNSIGLLYSRTGRYADAEARILRGLRDNGEERGAAAPETRGLACKPWRSLHRAEAD